MDDCGIGLEIAEIKSFGYDAVISGGQGLFLERNHAVACTADGIDRNGLAVRINDGYRNVHHFGSFLAAKTRGLDGPDNAGFVVDALCIERTVYGLCGLHADFVIGGNLPGIAFQRIERQTVNQVGVIQDGVKDRFLVGSQKREMVMQFVDEIGIVGIPCERDAFFGRNPLRIRKGNNQVFIQDGRISHPQLQRVGEGVPEVVDKDKGDGVAPGLGNATAEAEFVRPSFSVKRPVGFPHADGPGGRDFGHEGYRIVGIDGCRFALFGGGVVF